MTTTVTRIIEFIERHRSEHDGMPPEFVELSGDEMKELGVDAESRLTTKYMYPDVAIYYTIDEIDGVPLRVVTA